MIAVCLYLAGGLFVLIVLHDLIRSRRVVQADARAEWNAKAYAVHYANGWFPYELEDGTIRWYRVVDVTPMDLRRAAGEA